MTINEITLIVTSHNLRTLLSRELDYAGFDHSTCRGSFKAERSIEVANPIVVNDYLLKILQSELPCSEFSSSSSLYNVNFLKFDYQIRRQEDSNKAEAITKL